MPANGISITKNFAVLNRLIQDNAANADRALRGAAQEITNEIVLSFGTSVSAPGDPPGVDTNTLRGSMRWERVTDLHYEVMDGTGDYGLFLELGTSKMAARPFFTPVFEDWRARKFAQFMEDEMSI